MKSIAILIALVGAAAACPRPAEYPSDKPFVPCPTQLVKQRITILCLRPGSCLLGTQLRWSYADGRAALLAKWKTALRAAGWQVQRFGRGSNVDAWIRAPRGKLVWD